MKHLQLFEEYQSEIPDIARDMFGLTHTRDLQTGMHALIGPLENQEQAEPIAEEIDQLIRDAYEENDQTRELDDQEALSAVQDEMERIMEDPDFTQRLSAIGYRIVEA